MDERNQRRHAIQQALMHHVLAAWQERPATITDPVVVIADTSDPVGRALAARAGVTCGAAVMVVSAAEVAVNLQRAGARKAAEATRTADTRWLWLVTIALGGVNFDHVHDQRAVGGRPPRVAGVLPASHGQGMN